MVVVPGVAGLELPRNLLSMQIFDLTPDLPLGVGPDHLGFNKPSR